MAQIFAPTTIFSKKDTVYGIFHVPLNPLAKGLVKLARSSEFSADQLQEVRDMGIKVEVR